ncbi:MAG TPA: family 16 glycoside hydrolase [Sedimentisphaerales bacterium]|nr:family 16 glycoside hydrolase [Sedimentisphaerales bacterium]
MSKMRLGMILLVVAACVSGAQAKDKWRLGPQAYSFNRFTFAEAVAKAKLLNLKYIEAYPGQKLSAETGDARMDHNMSAEQKQAAKKILADAGITLVNYGVVGLPNNEAECRKVFNFAKEMGIETIVSEPPEDAMDLIDRLCQEYKICVALHNHPKPSHYWDYATVLRVCEGRSPWIGACADTGHWTRSEIDPVVAIRELGKVGRIRSLHFKDLNKWGGGAHDVPWGTGVSKVGEVLAELSRQGFEGMFSIEYEHNWDNSVPEIRKCVEWFKKTAAELDNRPYRDVFKRDLSNANMPPKGWAFGADGVLAPGDSGHGDIWTKERYGNFILELDYKVPDKGNSGVFIRTGNLDNWINTAIEVQIHATTDGTKHGQCGAIYDCLSPSKAAQKAPDEWNHFVITCLDNKIYVNLNGEDIIDMDLDQWTEAGKNPQGTKNKFSGAYKDMPREGHLGFQYHGNPIWFKNLKIKSLD